MYRSQQLDCHGLHGLRHIRKGSPSVNRWPCRYGRKGPRHSRGKKPAEESPWGLFKEEPMEKWWNLGRVDI